MFVKVCNKKTLIFAGTNKKVSKNDRKRNTTYKQFLSIILYQKKRYNTKYIFLKNTVIIYE